MRGVKLRSEWVEKGDGFLKGARRAMEEGLYWLACFNAHQAAELYLKGLLASMTGVHPYTHDLAELLEALRAIGVEPPSDVVLSSELLTPHYTLARYPGKRVYTYTAERGRMCIDCAEKIVEWVKKAADP
jgi:HEPN domain-containing protein